MTIRFVLNGKMECLATRPDRRVIDLLREDLGLTGTKEGCGSGECGACTILVDGETRLSCLMLAAQLDGRTVTTIEGVASDGPSRAVQAAFVERGAVQCGFCTPGMVMSALQLLARETNPGRDAIRRAISGNLCRCTGYQKIVDAIWSASEALRSGVGP
jgi:carbon-monoxide dehydrogenase small subunit